MSAISFLQLKPFDFDRQSKSRGAFWKFLNVCYCFEQTLWLSKTFSWFLCKSSTDCLGSVALNDWLVHEYKDPNSLQKFGGQFGCILCNFKAGQKSPKLPAEKLSRTCNQTQPELFSKCVAWTNEISKAYIMYCLLKLANGIGLKRKLVVFLRCMNNFQKGSR